MAESRAGSRRQAPARAATGCILLLPGALTLYVGFDAGGFHPGAVGVAAGVLSLALVLRIGLAEQPFEGATRSTLLVTTALAAFAAWTLLSATWSDAPARAILEFDRVLVYLLIFLLLASLQWTGSRARLASLGVGGAFVVIAAAGFLSRVEADWVVAGGAVTSRLSYPLTYWNAEGLACTLAILFCVHLASAEGPRALRAGACACIPLLGATLLLTFSRGAIAALVVGLVVYIAASRERGVVFTALAVAPGVVVAVRAAYEADLLAGGRYMTDAAQAQGQGLAVTVVVCCAGTLALRALLSLIETRLEHRARLVRGRTRLAVGLASAVAVVAVLLVSGVPGRAADAWHEFKESPPATAQKRDRLTQVSSNGRLGMWDVARAAFARERLHGTGAGTFQVQWAMHRPDRETVVDAHSLPLEVAGELGVVGLALLGVAIIGLLGGALLRVLRSDRVAPAVILAAGAAWLVHASIDWDWEMPSVTLWLFALGGLALARTREPASAAPQPAPRLARLVGMLVALLLALLPVQAALSQHRLNAAVSAFRHGDCDEAIAASLRASAALPVRPEPFQILAFCDARLGRTGLAARMAREAVSRDPENWEFPYSLSLVQGAGGTDPRPAAARALSLNPREPLARAAVRRFKTSDRSLWRRRALTGRLPLQ